MTTSISDLHIRFTQPKNEDYTAWLSVRNAVWADELLSLAQLKYEESIWPRAYFSQRIIVTLQDSVVAAAHLFENHWQYQAGKYDLDLLVHPDYQNQGIGSTLFNHFEQQLRARTPQLTSLVSGTREDQAHALAFLQKRGYKIVMRWARSQLDVASFSSEKFQPTLEWVKINGFAIYSVAEIARQDSDWQRKFYEMGLVSGSDAPSPDPMSETSFEKFVQNTIEPPSFLPEGTFIAIEEASGRWVASTELTRFANGKTFDTPFTSVHPDVRRRGLATAVKVKAIQFAQAAGAESIITSNEENNPMYKINLALGFKPLPQGLTLKKEY